MLVAQWIVFILTCYAAIGLVFGVAFTFVGAGRLDPAARGAGVGFKLLIIPASAALWPILAKRWREVRPTAGQHPHPQGHA